MTNEDDVFEFELVADGQNVLGVAGERRVALLVPGAQVGSPRADVIEQHDAMVVGECRPDEPPHVLVTAEAVGEHHWLTRWRALNHDVVALQRTHQTSRLIASACAV
jgi:hypothetical protein